MYDLALFACKELSAVTFLSANAMDVCLSNIPNELGKNCQPVITATVANFAYRDLQKRSTLCTQKGQLATYCT